jgi:hypothetical protein
MSSPFPGMDPYLEGPLRSSVHTQLSVEIARQLAPKLRPRYVPLTETVFLLASMIDDEGVAVAATDVLPDVAVARSRVKEPEGSGTAAAVAAPPLRLATVMPVRVPQVTVEIRDAEHRRLVTAIEVLSPTNKREGRRQYLRKRRRMLLSSAHLIEIDLLRWGRRVPMKDPLPDAAYFALVSRVEDRPDTDVWAIHLADRLPTIRVPLLSGDADVELDLQAAWSAVYDSFSYEFTVDYTRPPRPPLGPQENAWAQGRIRSWTAAR